MPDHRLTPEHLTKLETDRLALLAAHAAIGPLEQAVKNAQSAVEVAKARLEGLLKSVADAAFHGLDIAEAPKKLYGNAADIPPPSPKAAAIETAIEGGRERLSRRQRRERGE